MKIKLNETPEQLELLSLMASKDRVKSMEAQDAFAALITDPVQQVLNKYGSTALIYEDMPFDEDDSPEISLDQYYDKSTDYIATWFLGGGSSAPTNEVGGIRVQKLSWAEIGSAFSVDRKAAERNRLATVANGLNRMTQEMLRKKEILGWTVLMKALAEARKSDGTNHLMDATTESVLQAQDFSELITLSKRINTAWDNGTPDSLFTNGGTDLFLSPEMMQEIRGFAYQPMNTRTGTFTTSGATAIALPDSVRERIFNSSGMTEFYGKTLHELYELGVNGLYSQFFAQYVTGNVAFGSTYDSTTDDLIISIDLAKGTLVRPIARNKDTGATVNVQSDNLFDAKRVKKLGWFADQQLSFACVDSRALVGLIV